MIRWLRRGQHKMVDTGEPMAVIGQRLAEYRESGRPLLGRRTARRWLKELGERRRGNR